MNLNSSPSPFHMQQIKLDNNQQHYQPFVPNPSPSSSLSCHIFFGSTQDQTGFYDHHQFYRAQDQTGFYDHHQFYRAQHNSDDNYGDHQGGSTYEMKNKAESGLKLTLWKKEDDGHNKNSNTVKWMSSKMRLMQKMKNPDRTIGATLEDQKLQPSSSDTSSNSSSYNNGSPIRVCANCNTTKTPLWRSGPKGPKSLCNACGIRQRKARRALAATAAAANGTEYQQPPAVKIKVQHKEKTGKNGLHQKKRCKTGVAATSTVGSPSNGQKKIGFEDFLINISKNLAFHKFFPEDEKEAAILLMALSSGMVNG